MVLQHPAAALQKVRKWIGARRRRRQDNEGGAAAAAMADRPAAAASAPDAAYPHRLVAGTENLESSSHVVESPVLKGGRGEAESYPDLDLTAVPVSLREGVRCGAVRLALRIGAMEFSKAEWQFLLSLFPAEEVKKVQRYYQEKDRKLSLGSLLLQRRVSTWVHGCAFSDISILRAEKNKPYVDGTGKRLPRWNYNVSHHGQLVVFASEPHLSVGTDLVNLSDRPYEDMSSEDYLRHFERQLTVHEWATLMSISSESRRYDAFYRIWSMKEAYVKAVGLGLAFPLSRIDCQLGPIDGDVGHEVLVDGLEMCNDWNISFARLEPSYLWCTMIGSSAGAGMWPAKGSLMERCRSVFYEVTLEDLIPEDRLGEWMTLRVIDGAAAGAARGGLGRREEQSTPSPELATMFR